MSRPTMSVEVELVVFYHRIPFLRENTFRAFLPREQAGKGMVLENEWQLLVVLFDRPFQDVRCILSRNHDIWNVLVKVYGGGYTRELLSSTHAIAIPNQEWPRLLRRRAYVEGIPQWGYTDDNELRISEIGIEALFAYLQSTAPEDETG